jgi:hypothetical protein
MMKSDAQRDRVLHVVIGRTSVHSLSGDLAVYVGSAGQPKRQGLYLATWRARHERARAKISVGAVATGPASLRRAGGFAVALKWHFGDAQSESR